VARTRPRHLRPHASHITISRFQRYAAEVRRRRFGEAALQNGSAPGRFKKKWFGSSTTTKNDFSYKMFGRSSISGGAGIGVG